jgi:hypothetical protein
LTLDVKKSNSSNETPNVMTVGVEKYGLRVAIIFWKSNFFAIFSLLKLFLYFWHLLKKNHISVSVLTTPINFSKKPKKKSIKPNLPKKPKLGFLANLYFLANFSFFGIFWLFWKFLYFLEQVAVCHFGGYIRTT